MKIEDMQLWEAFHTVASQGNFTKAAKHLRIGTPLLSKRISKLEEHLGVRLFTRSTRAVGLTDEGRSILPRVNALLADITVLEETFEHRKELSGTIRITSVPFLAKRFLLPVVTEFTKKHPQLNFEFDLSESMRNLVENNFDLALRIHAEPEDSSLIYKKLLPNDLVFCATPKYLKSAPAIRTPADFHEHKVLMLDVHKKCAFKNSQKKVGDFVKSSKIKCNDGAFLTNLAMNDQGILLRSVWDVKEQLAKGTLVQVLKKHPLESFGHIYAVIPDRKLLSPKVRIFLDFLEEKLK